MSQRCAERNMVEVRTKADAQAHFGKERCSPRGNRGQRDSLPQPLHTGKFGFRAIVGDFIAGCNSITFHQCTTQRTRNLTRKVFQGGFHVGMFRSEIARKSNDHLGVWRPWHGRGAFLRDRFTVPWRNRG